VPSGFHVTLFASEPDIRRPIAFAIDDRGRLWVVENYAHPNWDQGRTVDRIVILEDANRDGRFDQRRIFWDQGRYLSAIALGHGGVWIGNTPELSFIPDRDRDDVPDSAPIVLLDGFSKNPNNMLNNFHWGPDGWLYGSQGNPLTSHVGKPETPRDERIALSRGIWRYHPTRHVLEAVADGMVNPWGADFNQQGDLFTVNCVLAHLWHIVPGLHCQRRGVEQGPPFTYRYAQSIADHLHWGGGLWRASAHPAQRHSVAGGGHAHCGAMIYLGDNWPEEYHGAFLTVNLHGKRVNCDRLKAHGSTYVGLHDDDFLLANDPWFRGLSLKYGPDGGVYLSDWHELGECHDQDGSHRTSGRIYKIIYGSPSGSEEGADAFREKLPDDLNALSSLQLADLHERSNEWFVRHARRILHERANAGQDISQAQNRLQILLETDPLEERQLRAMWSLYLMGALDRPQLVSLSHHHHEHVRKWAIYLLVDRGEFEPDVLERFAHIARDEESQPVRLALTAALQKLAIPDRWRVAEGLVARNEDAEDAYLPLMMWYGIEPLVVADTPRALRLAAQAKVPLVRELIARRALDVRDPPLESIVQFAIRTSERQGRLDVLRGIVAALEHRGRMVPPPSWEALYGQATASSDDELRSLGARLAVVFGDRRAMEQLQRNLRDAGLSVVERRLALQTMLKLPGAVSVELLHDVVRADEELRKDAIGALVSRSSGATPDVLLDVYPALSAAEQQAALGVLVTRSTFATRLVAAIESGEVDRNHVSAFALQQLRNLSDPDISRSIDRLWAEDGKQLAKSAEIARLRTLLSPEYLANASETAGRRVFERACENCHQLYGEGGTLGPDLTGSARGNLDYLLSNLIDPSALVDAPYRMTLIETVDGRVLTGFVAEHGEFHRLLRTTQGHVRLAADEIERVETLNMSMMPEGMLNSFTDEEIRDLVAYLRTNEQVPNSATHQ